MENQFDVLKDRPTSRPAEAIYFLKDEERETILSKFEKNDLAHNWTPNAPIYVHHGTMDTDVPYIFNAETTVNNLNDLGGNLILRKYKGHDHESLAQLYLLNMVDDFEQYH